ncbi:putative helicase senataxin isoform X2 [Andrena cerasifolii]|uniref:putative helicase senataxin isoform X2 n=1 Tax=Andrena cerasifolii TaxID=2819439 RepID=UPI004037B2FD
MRIVDQLTPEITPMTMNGQDSYQFVLERINVPDTIILDRLQHTYKCGRAKENEIVCLSLLVSRVHCTFFRSENELYVTDLKSANGLFINGVIQDPFQTIRLQPDDVIGVGCPEVDVRDNSMFAYKLRVVQPQVAETNHEATAPSETASNVDSSDVLTKRKRREENLDALSVPCKIQKLGENSGESSREGSHEVKDENDIEIVHISLNNSALEPSCSNHIAKSGESNGRLSTGKHTNTDMLGINAVDTKPKIGSDEDSEEMQSPLSNGLSNGVKRAKNSVVNKSTERSSKSTLRGAQTPEVKNLSNGKNAEIPGKIHNSNSSAKVATNAESVTRGSEQSPKQHDRSSNNFGKVGNSALKAVSLPPNFLQGEDTLIKMEYELQLTDNEEETMCNSSANSVPLISPMKLKKVQQEPKTRFSEVDVVNLSDSEDDIFPCSQLFDIGFGMDASMKQEVKEEKEEPTEAENERLNRLEDDLVISLSDSEDEDNTWLRRLSQSQQLNEVSVKTEVVDEGLMDVDDAARASEIADDDCVEAKGEKRMEECINREAKKFEPRVNGEEKYMDASLNEEEKERETRVNENEEEEEEDASLQDARLANILRLLNSSVDKTKINCRSRASSAVINKKSSLSPRNRILLSKEREADGPVVPVSPAAEEAASSRRKKPLEKKIPEVDPPHLPTRRRSRSSSTVEAEASKATKKRISAKERKEMKEKEKLEQYSREKEQKARKTLNKWADIPLLFNKAKASSSVPPFSSAPLTKEEKKEITDSRKAKLKKLAMEKKLSSSESNNQEKKRIATKPKAKVSAKTRLDVLVEDISATKAEEATERSRSSSRSRVGNNVTSPKPKVAERMTNRGASKETPRCKSPSVNNLSRLGRIPKKRNASEEKSAAETASEDATLAATMTEVLTIEKKDKSKVKPSTVVRAEPRATRKSNIKSSTGGPKKRVSFSTVINTVHIYEIDDTNILRKLQGKDAPLPAKPPARNHHGIIGNMKVNEFLLRIFSWSPVWLEEQQRLDRIPPVVRDEDLHSMLTHYSSYLEYCNNTVPLLLLETWSRLTKEFQSIEQDFRRRTVMCSIVEGSVQKDMVEPNLYMTNLMLEVLITKADLQKQAHPNFGDLVVLEYAKNHLKGQTFHRVFAYVTQMYQTTITPKTHYNKDLVHYVKSPHTVITYTMKTKPLEPNILVNRVQRLRGVTYLRSDLRLVQALDYLPRSPLVSLILSPKTDTYHLPLPSSPEPLVTKDKLNQRQMEAVCKVTEAVVQKQAKLCFIQGPPGTGKTRVIANIVTQVLYGNQRYTNNTVHLKILVCAPSNAAIDEITLRLLAIRSNMKEKRFKMVRIGRADAMHPSVKDISIAELARREMRKTVINSNHTVCSAESVEQEKAHLESKMNALRCEMSNTRNLDEIYLKHLRMKLEDVTTKYELLKHRRLLNEMNSKETMKLQRAAENRVLEHADVITCTLNSCYNNQMESVFVPNKNRISVCIVDEATQSCEAESLIPLMLGVNTLVLVGDPNQLPATILSTRAKELGLDQSIFSRVQNAFEFHPNNPIILLDTQYRMAQAIAQFPTNFFYGGRLKNAAPQTKNFPYHAYRILNLNNKQDTDSFTNTNEAKFVADLYLTMLTAANLDSWESISFGILTPYNNQKAAIQGRIDEITPLVPEDIRKKITCEVNTIDSFQGQERDVIILSCVRSEKIGFLSDKQRLCVALTRAKHSLIVCGNFNTGTKFVKDTMWRALLSDARGRQMYFTVKAKAEPRHIHPHVVKTSALR